MRTFSTLTLFLFCQLTFAQTDSNIIVKIRKTVEQINKDSNYITKTLENEQFLEHMTDRGGQLTGYFKNGRLVKIVEWVGLSSCIDITEYYLKDNELIFAYIQGKEFQYVDSIARFDSYKQIITMECRFYFENGKMTNSTLTGETRCGGKPTDTWSKAYLENSSRYEILFKTKK